MDSRFPERLAGALAGLAGVALVLVLLGLAVDSRLLTVGVVVLVMTPLVALAGAGVTLLRSAPRVGLTALVTVAIAILGALLGA